MRKHDQGIGMVSCHGGERGLELVHAAHLDRLQADAEAPGGSFRPLELEGVDGVIRIPQSRHAGHFRECLSEQL